jgi:hypothetical protein
MLFRNLIATYGNSLAGKSTLQDDPVWHLGRTDDLLNFRQYALGALQQAKVYLLDHFAAAYADTLHDSIQEALGDGDVAALTFLGEVKLPAPVVWVEFDYQELVASRVQRTSPSIVHEESPSGTGQRGYLFDNRNLDALNVTMFSCDSRGKVVDPFFTLRFDRAGQSEGGLTSFQPEFHRYMSDILSERGMAAQEIQDCQRRCKFRPRGGATSGRCLGSKRHGAHAHHIAGAGHGALALQGQSSSGGIRRCRWICACGFGPGGSSRRSSRGC